MKPGIDCKPPLRYFGAKWRIADWITDYLPKHECYVEVFGGSAAVLLRKSRARVEVYNDINGDVVNFFEVLRDRGHELATAIALTPYSRREYEASFVRCEDVLERARRTCIRSWQGRGGYRRTGSTSWRFTCGVGQCSAPSQTWSRVPERLLDVAERLRGVSIESDDWSKILERYDRPGTLFYLDPPYVTSARAAKYEYEHEMSNEDHSELLDAVGSLEGMAIISGYQCELYETALCDWEAVSIASRTQNGASTEYLWISPAAQRASAQRRLFSSDSEGATDAIP